MAKPKRLRTIEDSSDEESRAEDQLSNSEDSIAEEEEEEEEDVEEDDEEDEEDDDEDDDDDGEAEEEEEEDEEDEDEIDEASVVLNPKLHMTARQRNKLNGTSANIGLIDLAEIEGTNRPKKIQLSAEEQRIKRAEMARRRRNLSQQRLEEEKKETLDKLLKKRAKKMRGDEENGEDGKSTKSKLLPKHPAFATWQSSKDGELLSVIDAKRLE